MRDPIGSWVRRSLAFFEVSESVGDHLHILARSENPHALEPVESLNEVIPRESGWTVASDDTTEVIELVRLPFEPTELRLKGKCELERLDALRNVAQLGQADAQIAERRGLVCDTMELPARFKRPRN